MAGGGVRADGGAEGAQLESQVGEKGKGKQKQSSTGLEKKGPVKER
jgi:hypothetical protein